ncbi:MAG: DNA helicase RecG, partial [Actinobacteria bacterium]|nr:DNA helicase RecG [Actinomycetota bacterium]
LANVIGEKTAKVFKEIFGYVTVEQLLHHYPRRYVMRGELTEIASLQQGEEVTILAQIAKVHLHRTGAKNILDVTVTDGISKLHLTFFNQAWREKNLIAGKTGLFAGKVGSYKGKLQLSHPDYQLISEGKDVDTEVANFAGKYLPVYPASGKLPSWKIAKCIELALNAIGAINDPIPLQILQELDFPDLSNAFTQIHVPDDLERAERARLRLAFNEAFLLQLLLKKRRAQLKRVATKARLPNSANLVSKFDERLPFNYTDGQKEIIEQINRDLSATIPMHRLIQGEVGSGKTVLALRAMLSVIDSGAQTALLAPTEVLAQQHFRTIHNLFTDFTLSIGDESLRVALLTGSLPTNRKRDIRNQIKNGEIDLVIGTHALIGDGVEFADLGLLVIDEQHRFGVEQRDALRLKAKYPPHVLVMTATPIPRTVAMTVFGDLDLSTLRQLPKGRIEIETHLVALDHKPHYLDRAWQRVREEVEKGNQVYIVVARIENPKGKLKPTQLLAAALLGEEFLDDQPVFSISELAPKLADKELKGLKMAVLHGRLSPEEKEATMNKFASGEISVLITTTVIEVGVDVPNATMMVIMDADRFGVSQLHQLRGRVGRGEKGGLCLLVTNATADSPAIQRLSAVASTNDGFELARLDLEQRKEGDILGAAQSGGRSQLRLLRVLRDESIILKAAEFAETILADDSTLKKYPDLSNEIERIEQEQSAQFLEKM